MRRWAWLLLLIPCTVAAQGKGDPRHGEALYKEKCVLCHGGHGEGWDWGKKVAQPPVPVPDLGAVVPERDDQFLFTVVREGGEAVGKTRFMPAFGFQLSDADVWDLVAYLRAIAEKGK